MTIRLAAQNLACHRGGRLVFEKLSFDLKSGELALVVGPNGAGKSSLLRQIAGLISHSTGELALEGGESERTISEQAHYLGHKDALKSSLSVAENLNFWTRYLGGAGHPDALARIGLGALAELPAEFLSAGQRRRLSLARLLTVFRPVWLLDEPTSALDASGQTLLVALMKEHLGRNGIILASTHGPVGLSPNTTIELGSKQ